MQRRRDTLDQLRRGKIIGDHGVRQLPVIDQRIQRHMDPDAAGVAESHGLPQLLRGEIARRAAGVKAGQPQINSISAAEHSGAKHLTVSRRGQNLGAAHSSSTVN